MIISRTPFRISFVGGGTDFQDYYKYSYGSVISSTIDKYLYVTVNERFDKKVNIRYSSTEEVKSSDQVQHGIIREALKLVGISKGIEIVTIADIPGKGSGLGSSSALAVGLLNALYAFKGCYLNSYDLARQACKLEIEILKAPIGKQDQWSTAVGGFGKYTFNSNENVTKVDLLRESVYDRIKQLENNSLLFYLGFTRSAGVILKEHKENIDKKRNCLNEIRKLSDDLESWLYGSDGSFPPEQLLTINWEYKKRMADGVTTPEIDLIIDRIKGVYQNTGVKLCGAGGGGFMLVVAPVEHHEKIRLSLQELHELKFNFTNRGSEIIYNDRIS